MEFIISIHALLAESDGLWWCSWWYYQISIHALLAESDIFPNLLLQLWNYFYPRSPCGERQLLPYQLNGNVFISIHALLAESDGNDDWYIVSHREFLSTLSLRRATFSGQSSGTGTIFLSTLSLRRATRIYDIGDIIFSYFYPRSPCGERQMRNDLMTDSTTFLSTLSLRRATRTFLDKSYQAQISIHALLAESDPLPRRNYADGVRFLSTLSLRRATEPLVIQRDFPKFLSTLSLRRATNFRRSFKRTISNFYPRSPCGERPRQNQNL